MERERLSRFARRLLSEWARRGWPAGGERVVVAVSGGADSTALLLGLDELLKAGRLDARLTAAHLNHGLRGERGADDALWVEGLARSLGHEVVVGRSSLGGRDEGGARRDNLEQAARRARYEFLSRVAQDSGAVAVLAAHTLDDQAETVLLRLLRGSGAEGLGGIRPERALEGASGVRLLRPLVAWARRADTEDFCRGRGVEARSDEMNADERFARVRVRRGLLPLLETFNPRVAETLARTADLLCEDARALELEAARLLEAARETGGEAVGESPREAGALRVAVLAAAPKALRRRALRRWLAEGRGDLRRLGAVHVAAVEKLLQGEKGGRVVELPGGARIVRRRGLLSFGGEKD